MFHRIKSVKPLPNYMLYVTFLDNVNKEYDVTPLFDEIPVFSSLQTVQGLFDQVSVDAGGYGISWNSEIDLSCDELWFNGKTSTP